MVCSFAKNNTQNKKACNWSSFKLYLNDLYHDMTTINRQIYYFLLTILLLLEPTWVGGQTTIKGLIRDSESFETLPFVNVFIKNTMNGTASDLDGVFMLKADTRKDTIGFKLIGYHDHFVPANQFNGDTTLVLLTSSAVALNEIRVKPNGEALRLTRLVINSKKRNNPENHNRAAYEKYSKWEFALNNISDRLQESWIFKNGQNLMRYAEDSTRYLPVYFSEQLTFNELQKDPLKQKSTILADRTTGLNILKDYEISGYSSALDMEVNFYNNIMVVFGQSFISPIADNGPFYYHYYLTDSLETASGKQYVIKFKPKRPGDKTFVGTFTMETAHHTLVEIDATLSEKSNINFVKELKLKSDYQLVDDSLCFFKRNEIEARLDYIPVNSSKKRLELNYRMANTVDKVDLNPSLEVKLSMPALSYETIKVKDATQRDSSYWNQIRPENLSATDHSTANAIDSLNNLKPVKFLDNLARMTVTGYYDLGRYEFGPFMEAINTNKVEGLRLFVGGRTSKEFSTRWQFWAGVGYGTKNEKLAGHVGAGYKFDSHFRKVLKVSFNDKIVRIGESDKILYLYENMMTTSESNLVALVMQRDEMDELIHERKIKLDYEHEWRSGLDSRLKIFHTTQYSPVYYPFTRMGSPIDRISQSEVAIDTRWSWKEKYFEDGLQRLYIGSKYPVIHLTIAGGEASVENQQHWYSRFHTTLKHNFYIGLGEVQYAVEGGMVFGSMPYTMLEIPRGNKTYGLYSYDFNLLDYLEFANDKYLNIYADYHLNGFFFNRIPLLKKLGLREVVGFKSMLGSLDDRHREVLDYARDLRPLNGAYLELNAGVENIVRFFRLDAIWRVSPNSTTGAPLFGLRAQFNVKL